MKIELRRVNRTKPESTYIRSFASNVTSQFGEDGMIAKIFDLIGVKNRWCVEFGAWDGKYLSNTWDLINNKGWSAVLAEGDRERATRLAETHRDSSSRVFVENAYVSWEGESSLDAILSHAPIPTDFDLLSIDIDGNDWHVWNALTQYRPRIVVGEFNPTASNQLYFVQDADASLNQGASLLAMVDLAKSKGYELAACSLTNAMFVLAADFPRLAIADNTIDAMHEDILCTEICHGYDGTMFAAGHMFLNWHGLPLHQEDFQVIPKALRKYPDPGDRGAAPAT